MWFWNQEKMVIKLFEERMVWQMVDVVNKEFPFRIHSSEKLTELRQGCSNLEALRKEPAALSRRIVQR